MIKIVRPIAGVLAILTIATFWLSTAVTELFASQAMVTTVENRHTVGLPIANPGAGNGRRLGLWPGKGATLLGLNMRDGLKMSGRLRPQLA
jgi:hypothetical protein